MENFPSPSKLFERVGRVGTGGAANEERSSVLRREKVTNGGRYFVAIYRFVSSIFAIFPLPVFA